MITSPSNKFIRALILVLISMLIAITLVYNEPRAGENYMNDYSMIFETMTEQEYEEMVNVMFLECRGERFEGKVAVAETIFNRVLSDYFPDTVHDVLSQRGQFSTWYYVNKVPSMQEHGKEQALQEIRNAIVYAYYNGHKMLPSIDYVYFDTKGRNGIDHIHIGLHYFGRIK